MQRWKKSSTTAIFSLFCSFIVLFYVDYVNSQDYFGSYPMFGGLYGGSPSVYDDDQFSYKPMRRSFGQPNGFANSHDAFDQEKTMDERISAKMNPLPYLFNPGVRQGITTLQQMEARKQQLPTRKFLPRNFFF